MKTQKIPETMGVWKSLSIINNNTEILTNAIESISSTLGSNQRNPTFEGATFSGNINTTSSINCSGILNTDNTTTKTLLINGVDNSTLESNDKSLKVMKGDSIIGNELSHNELNGKTALNGVLIQKMFCITNAAKISQLTVLDGVRIINPNSGSIQLIDFTPDSTGVGGFIPGDVDKIKISTSSAVNGQTLRLIVWKPIDENNNPTITILPDFIKIPRTVGESQNGIPLTKSSTTLDFIFYGGNWILTDKFEG